MSQEAVTNFFQSLEADPLMQEEVKNAENSDRVIQIASQKGYEFTVQELQESMQGTLTEEELEAVAGGKSSNNINGGSNNIKG